MTKPEQQLPPALAEAAKALGVTVDPSARPQDRYMHVNRVRLHYLDWGTAGLRPMLLLHGSGEDACSWDFLATLMRARYHVYALDLRGHGASDWAPDGDYSHTAFIEDIAGFVRSLGLHKFVLIGFSLGGSNALRYAAAHPETVATLVILDVGLRVANEALQGAGVLFRPPYEEDSFEAFVERAYKTNPQRSKESYRETLIKRVKQLPNGKWTWRYDPRHLRPEVLQAAPTPSEQSISSIRCPTLIVRGQKSRVFLPEEAQRLLSLIPGSTLVQIEHAGHRVLKRNPVGLAVALHNFLLGAQMEQQNRY